MASGFVAKLDDWLNPIVVKELRQAVQSKFVVALLLLFLLLQLIFIGVFLMVGETEGRGGAEDYEAGRRIFMVLQAVLLGTCMLFIPAYTGLRLATERSEANVDLLFVSTLRPRAIIWGKFLAALILVLLIFSTCAPFMTFTYLLRGIDVPTILYVLGIDFLVVTVAIQVVIFLAVVPANRVFKALLGMMGFVALLYLFGGTVSGTLFVLEFGVGFFRDAREFWAGILSGVVLVLAGIALLFSWSVALISPPSANRSLLVRLFMLGVWLLTGVVFVVGTSATGDAGPLQFWISSAGGMFLLGMVIAINEREQWGPRIARTIPRRWWLRLPAFFLYSGAAGGLAFAVLMLGLTLAAVSLLADQFDLRGESLFATMRVITMMALYVYSYALTAVLFRRLGARHVKREYTWIVGLFLLAIGSVVPFLISILFLYKEWRYESHFGWLLANPFAAVTEAAQNNAVYGNGTAFFAFASCWAMMVTLVNIPWFLQQVGHFRPAAAGVALVPSSGNV